MYFVFLVYQLQSYSSQNVCKVTAEDLDKGLNALVSYTIISGKSSVSIPSFSTGPLANMQT